MEFCLECRRGKNESEMTTLLTNKKNVIRRCCDECKIRILMMRKQAKSLAKQKPRTTIG